MRDSTASNDLVLVSKSELRKIADAMSDFYSFFKRTVTSGCVPSEELYFAAAKAHIASMLDREATLNQTIDKVSTGRPNRTDEKIVKQTEELARYLLCAFHGQEAVSSVQLRTSTNIRALACWQAARQAQILLTETDPMDAVYNLEE